MNAEPNGSICQWQHSLFPDILAHISDLLPLPDFFSFRATCRAWRAAPSGRSNITQFSNRDFWVIFYDLSDDHQCLVYDLNTSGSCVLRLPSLRHSTCIISKHGWLLLVRDDDPSRFFFYNPFFLQEIPLPPYPNPAPNPVDMYGEFSPLPTSPNCVAYIVSSRGPSTVEIARLSLAVERAEWMIRRLNIEGAEQVLQRGDVIYCQCAEDASCECMRKSLLVVQTLAFSLTYNMETREHMVVERPMSSLWEMLGSLVENYLRRRFGKGFAVSFPRFSSKNKCFRPYRLLMSTGQDDRAAAEGMRMKAAFIDPVFTWRRRLGGPPEQGGVGGGGA